MSEERIDLGEAVVLADPAQRMRKYLLTVQAAYAFFFNGLLAGAYWLAVTALAFLLNSWNSPLFWVAALLALIPVLILASYVAAAASPRVTFRAWRPRRKFTVLFFAAFFVILYALPWPGHIFVVVWYPALGSPCF